MLTAGWTNLALREHVANRLGRYPYAAIQVDLPMMGALPRRDAIPIVYNAHNCGTAATLVWYTSAINPRWQSTIRSSNPMFALSDIGVSIFPRIAIVMIFS